VTHDLSRSIAMAVWTLDDLGNWTEFRNDAGDGETWDLDQNRVHNTANEIHGNSGDPIHPEGGSGLVPAVYSVSSLGTHQITIFAPAPFAGHGVPQAPGRQPRGPGFESASIDRTAASATFVPVRPAPHVPLHGLGYARAEFVTKL
jgi:hypothetical protein